MSLGDGSPPLEFRRSGGQVPQKIVIFGKLYYFDVIWKKTKQYCINLALKFVVLYSEWRHSGGRGVLV